MELFVFYRKSFNLGVWLGLEYARENAFVKKMLIKLSSSLIEAVLFLKSFCTFSIFMTCILQ